MSGLCGWTGRLGLDVPAECVLATMAGGLAGTRSKPAASRADQSGGLHLDARSPICHFDALDDLWAAIDGQPRWSLPELTDIAKTRGHAAALKAGYRRLGQAVLDHLHGAFSLALLNRVERKAMLAIDRFGVNSMYFAAPPRGGLVFGSTADSVRFHPGGTSTIPLQAIYNYLCSSVVRGPKTIYREQRKLLPAQYLLWTDGQVHVAFYWQVPYAAGPAGRTQIDLADDLLTLLRQATGRCVEGAPAAATGAFLSGGLDSSTIAGLLSEVDVAPVKTFTVSFDDKRYDEAEYARAAARHFNTEQHEYRMTAKDVTDLAAKVAAAYDEPFGNSSALPAYCCARLAKQHGVSLLLAGDGGDEIFAGNRRYVQQLKLDRYGRIPEPLRRIIIEPIVFRHSRGEGSSLARRVRNYIAVAKIPLPDRLVAYELHVPSAIGEIFNPEALAEIAPEEPLDELREVYAQAPSDNALQRMLYLDLRVTLADNDLRKVGRMCELADVSVQFPMLDEELVEFSARVPPDWLVRGNRLRHFYKEALRTFLPQKVVTKTKHGFGMPYGSWVHADAAVSQYVRDCLQTFKGRHYLRTGFIDDLIDNCGKDRRSAWNGLTWDIMMLALWLDTHASGGGSA